MFRRCRLLALSCVVALPLSAQVLLPNARPIPLVQAVPQPYEQVSFQREGTELARLHFGPGLNRPFIFPLLGPSGRSVTAEARNGKLWWGSVPASGCVRSEMKPRIR